MKILIQNWKSCVFDSSFQNPFSGSGTFDLKEEQKRWLVIGICLNKLLLPTLRDFAKVELRKHYITLKRNHNIDTQTYPRHLKKDAKFNLNYGSINNNEANHGKKASHYDYGVKSEVDLAKLYLLPYMAKFSGKSGFLIMIPIVCAAFVIISVQIFRPLASG